MSIENSTAFGLTAQDLEKLKAPFPDDVISIKAQSFSKDKTKVALVQYVQHTDAYNRIEEVDPNWAEEILETNRCEVEGWQGKKEQLIEVRMRMIIKGVSRENVGEGDTWKSAVSDAIKRCAVLFGVGRYLYDTGVRWVPYNEHTDKYRQWTAQDYFGKDHKTTSVVNIGTPKPTDEQLAELTNLAKDIGMTGHEFGQFVKNTVGKDWKSIDSKDHGILSLKLIEKLESRIGSKVVGSESPH